MPPSLYLINPRADFPTYYGAEVYAGRGYRPAAFLADLVMPTVAAMVPEGFEVRLCDEHLEPVDLDAPVDFVGITGKVSQLRRMRALADAFRARGVVVLIGGPHATLSPGSVREHCDVLVRGEIEEIAGELFGDLASGRWKDEYVGTTPDLALTPVPRWDLYARHHDRTLTATLQTARGCPFECEFCDVIQYVGRRQRKKPVARILEELDVLYAAGYRGVLFADDNTTASRHWVKEMLAAVRDWNAGRDERVAFSTQLSVDAARDDEMLQLCHDAGMTHVFVGVETPNEESLLEAKKRQNLRRNLRNEKDEAPTLVDQVHRFYDFGIGVTGGMICGFDHDEADVFERQYRFGMESAIPIFTISALVAPEATPLHARMQADGRLADGGEVPGHPWNTNLVPARMSRAELAAGVRRLANALYHPDRFAERVERYLELLRCEHRDARTLQPRPGMRSVDRDTLALLSDLPRLDAATARMWERVTARLAARPGAAIPLMEALVRYAQMRFMYEDAGAWDGDREPAFGVGAAAGRPRTQPAAR